MCGRFVRHTNVHELARLVGALDFTGNSEPSYNVAPTQNIHNAYDTKDGRVLKRMRWGLVPRWAKDATKLHPINARAETVASNGVFRTAFRQGRTLIPADGFYEWRKTESGKQPYYIYRHDGAPMWFAGVCDTWRGEGERLTSCAIITTSANEVVKPLHDRMPVILTEEAWAAWLDRSNDDTASLERMLRPCDESMITLRPVSKKVNNTRNDEPDLIEPISA